MLKFIVFQTKTVVITIFLLSCAQPPKLQELPSSKNEEFNNLVQVEPVKVVSEIKKRPTKVDKKDQKIKVKSKLQSVKVKSQDKLNASLTTPQSKNKTQTQPNEPIKTDIGNPKMQTISEKDLTESPFKVGEKTVIEVSYLNMTAGYLTLETKGIVKVNGRMSYHFRGSINSRKLFAFVYSVNDVADTYVDIKTLKPYSLNFKVIETKKTKDSKTFFDWKAKKATYWSRKVKKGRKPKEVKKVWDLPDGAQNFVSALFYLRTIDFSKVKQFSFPMADEGKNVMLKAKVIRKEKIETQAGTFDAWLVEPKFHIDGSLAPVDQLRMWFKADKSQSLVKVQTRLKFGSIVGEAKQLVQGSKRKIDSLINTNISVPQ